MNIPTEQLGTLVWRRESRLFALFQVASLMSSSLFPSVCRSTQKRALTQFGKFGALSMIVLIILIQALLFILVCGVEVALRLQNHWSSRAPDETAFQSMMQQPLRFNQAHCLLAFCVGALNPVGDWASQVSVYVQVDLSPCIGFPGLLHPGAGR